MQVNLTINEIETLLGKLNFVTPINDYDFRMIESCRTKLKTAKNKIRTLEREANKSH